MHHLIQLPRHLQRQMQTFSCLRHYHSEKGVYGYRPLPRRHYDVSQEMLEARNAQPNIYRLIEAYRKYGHKLSFINPVDINNKEKHRDKKELCADFYGLTPSEKISVRGLLNCCTEEEDITINKLESILQNIYCSSAVSAEFEYIENHEERNWLVWHYEQLHQQNLNQENRREIAELLIKAQTWDNFMASKFPTVKRYSGEGAESLLVFFWQLLRNATQEKIEYIVLAMPHRGRTNLQTILLNMRPAKIFRKLRGESEFPDGITAMSDVISHFHISDDLLIDGKQIHFNMIRNPSHLEAANPVAMGKTRSKQQSSLDGAFNDNHLAAKPFGNSAINILVHGDAAFPGQGINQECLNMAYVPHFEIGGSIHLIVNNQVGFTTPAQRGRSTDYTSDLAKTIQAPVFHVNGNNPDMMALVTKLAFEYQRQFRKDIFIDMNCFRRWGHNELDDPTFTNPRLYKLIHNRKSVPDNYIETLTASNTQYQQEIEQIRIDYLEYLNTELDAASTYQPEPTYFQRQWKELTTAPDSITYWDTGLDYNILTHIGRQSVAYPTDFNVHPHLLKTHIEGRLKRIENGTKIDWSTAEAFAIGSLMYQGHNVRLSGEDVGRGTFSHRHTMLVDQQSNEMLIPLNGLEGGCGKLEIAHSILSEEAVLGFEYGMAIDNPMNLIIWEAQFGDFANGAQIIIDNFIVSGETKWMDSNGLVILLPHGYDGAASEHSSCRIERFLQLCDSKETAPDGDNVNINIVNPTTPAQYYHVLRRQMMRNFRKPLVIIAPKTLLRLSAATSTHIDFQPGMRFYNVLGDNDINESDNVRRIILCSGKHFYNLHEERQRRYLKDTAIVRLESLCPFPLLELQEELTKYKNAQTFIWCQEEQRNMGAWTFVRPRFEYLIGKQLRYCGRSEAPTTATGVGKIHKSETEMIVTQPFDI